VCKTSEPHDEISAKITKKVKYLENSYLKTILFHHFFQNEKMCAKLGRLRADSTHSQFSFAEAGDFWYLLERLQSFTTAIFRNPRMARSRTIPG